MGGRTTIVGNVAAWNSVAANLVSEMGNARDISLKRWALKAEAIAKTHLSNQDLPWAPLKAYTVTRKLRLGYSSNILIETSTYLQSITSWVILDTAYVGVKRDKRYALDGKTQSVSYIAKIHEFGLISKNIAARPLWKPTFNETMKWHTDNNTPEKIFSASMGAKYRI